MWIANNKNIGVKVKVGIINEWVEWTDREHKQIAIGVQEKISRGRGEEARSRKKIEK
jgi:hypothetical protein